MIFFMKIRKAAPSRTSIMNHLFQEFLVAIFIILILLFFFAYSLDSNPIAQAAGTQSDQLQEYVRLCVQGIQQACEKAYEAASSS